MAALDAHNFINPIFNQFAREHDVNHQARRNLIINQFAREHNVVNHQALRNSGLFLMFVGASIIMGGATSPQQSSDTREDIFMAFTAFVMGVLMISLSLAVNYAIPHRAAAFVDAVLNHLLVVINAICLIDL